MLKRFFPTFALALTLVTFLVPFNASAQATKSRLQKVQETGVLRVGTTGDFMPMSFRDPGSNEFRGHQIDAANELAKELGVKVEFVVTDWKSIMTAVQSDKFDIAMTGTSMSVARAKAAAFSIPWGKNAFFPLVLKKDAAKFKSWEALNNPKVTAAYNLGTTMEQFVQTNMPKAKIRRVESPARDFQELLAGKADFMVASLIEGAALMKQYPELQLVLLDKPKNSIPMAFLMAGDDQQWLNFVNNWITIKKQNGYFTEINKKWGVLGQE
jgi:cyclohexadienyl dehydratase